jgi:hypothetical protein
MPLMNVFEPLFLLLALTTVITLAWILVTWARGDGRRAARALRRLGIGAGLYFAIVILVSAIGARHVYRVGDKQCFDDWCIAVSAVSRTPAGPETTYDVTLTMSSRAKVRPMGETGTVVYLIDADGHRYDPLPDPNAIPFDTLLEPGGSAITQRRFVVAAGARDVSLVYTHEGGFPIGSLIITEGGWFAKPPVVQLD